MTTRAVNGLQGLAALIGITFGLLPLAKLWFGANAQTIWTRLLGAMSETTVHVLAGGTVCLAIVAISFLERRRPPITLPEDALPRRDWLGPVQILCLAGLSAVGAELLAAYAENTGNVLALLFALVFFMALYGAPALLARELVRRAGWGWPSLLLLALALGIAQACLIDQSLFSADYIGYEGWAEARQDAFIPMLSISANQAWSFIVGHVIFSFGAPIAIAEAWRPHRAREPWLGPVGIVIAVLAYVGTALLVAFDPSSRSASATQFIASALLVLACILTAWRIGRGARPVAATERERSSISPLAVFAIALVPALALAMDLFAEGWAAFALNVTVTGAIGALVWRRARRPGWTVRHIAAVALAFLVSRGALAFTYFPLAGQVEAPAKYGHNIVMMLIVLIAGWFALRPGATASPAAAGDPDEARP
ncbi:hypothetical protein RCO27_19220 [Sphingosinicella sp. LHD-64]|uniref:hypothetical protein n=1 Tax=Sphingosinicella sp. LHD-64 TaxID=3072139 RepID=UPI00280F5615|nr:hypothetical protein [Sphingosinicella sp. LHD-64]MDQ8758366.1 hypothetical protein [Sphingosinicella sp. LHD-64]